MTTYLGPGTSVVDSTQADIDQQTRLKLFRSMQACRQLEQRAHDLFFQNLIKGTSHLGLGQEAVASGFGVAMSSTDYTFCTYRGHNHVLVRGASMPGILGELMGRECGLLNGKGGSMHLTSVEHGHLGSYAIVGAQLCIALGSAWSAQYRGTDQVTVCFFGDGTTNIGTFHEALNLAATWKLPVIYVCENNKYMEYTPIDQVTSVENPAADRASAYGLESIIVDGNDVDEVYRIAQQAIGRARSGGGPSLIEAKTYRHSGHSRADPATYRPDGELEDWLQKDPIVRYRQRLLEIGVAESELARIESEIKNAVDEATEIAKASPAPDVSTATTNLWADGGSAWRN